MPSGVYDHKDCSEATKKKLSIALKGKTYEEIYGIKEAENQRVKRRHSNSEEACSNMKGKSGVYDHKHMRGENNPAKRLEIKAILRIKALKQFEDLEQREIWGIRMIENNPMKNIKSQQKSSISHKKYSGAETPNWRGGISNFPYHFNFNEKFRESIRQRDNNVCQLCERTKEEEDRNLTVHHIYYDKMNDCADKDDFITLCVSCNGKVNTNRIYWMEFFRIWRQNNGRCMA